MEVALGQRYSISFIENNILKERLEKFDTALWNSSVQDLQCTETFGHFFSNKRKINHMYDLLFQLQRDLIPEECRGKQGYLKVFLNFVHEQLNLSTHFKFDAEKLANIIRLRNRRYNIVSDSTTSEISTISKFLITNKNMIAFSEYIKKSADMKEFIINNLENLLEIFNERQKKIKKTFINSESIKKSIDNILSFIDSQILEDSMLLEETELKMNKLGHLLSNKNLILDISKSNIQSNGIYYKQLSTHRRYSIMISNVEMMEGEKLDDMLYVYIKLNIIMKHLKINGPFKLFYQLVLMNADKPRLARKNKCKLSRIIELTVEKIRNFERTEQEMETF